MAVPMVSSAKWVTFGGFTCGVALFCVAGVALPDIQTCFVACRKSLRNIIQTCFVTCRKSLRNTFATFSQDDLQFSWQAQHFGRVHRHFAWQAQHVSCCVFFVNRIVRAASSGDKAQILWQAWHFVRCADN